MSHNTTCTQSIWRHLSVLSGGYWFYIYTIIVVIYILLLLVHHPSDVIILFSVCWPCLLCKSANILTSLPALFIMGYVFTLWCISLIIAVPAGRQRGFFFLSITSAVDLQQIVEWWISEEKKQQHVFNQKWKRLLVPASEIWQLGAFLCVHGFCTNK